MARIKPIVIIADGNGRVTMTVDEMKKLLDDAFEQGRESASTTINNYPVYRSWWNDPYYTTTCGTVSNQTLTTNTTETTSNLTVKGENE